MSSIEVRWMDDEKSILLYEIREAWTLEQFFKLARQISLMSSAAQHQINLIGYIDPRLPLPSGNFLSSARIALGMFPYNIDLFVTVGGHHYIVTVMEMFSRTIKKPHIKLAATVEEALNLINKDRANKSQ